ncbi:MAG: hypothetical protein IV107_08260 [Paucibacter sp.]|nr:hypothetical protein [Roseateles sp.]
MNKFCLSSAPSRQTRAQRSSLRWVAAAAALLAGCASPIQRIDAPGYSVVRSPAPTASPTDMAGAVAKLEHFRATYYEAIVTRAQLQQNATAGLVWLGTAVAAMAAGTVHRDAILGATLVGGTTYGLTRVQLDARHVQVWNQGIKALNCAREASLPMDIGTQRTQALEAANAQLAKQRSSVAELRTQAAATATLVAPKNAELARSAFDLLSKVDEILIQTDRTANAAAALLHQSSGADLAVTVDKIHAKVTEALSDLLVDVSAVPQLIAGLGGFASGFAPGVDVGAMLSEANKRIAKVTNQSLGGTEDMTKLAQQMQSLKSEMDQLNVEQQRVSGMLLTVDHAAVLAALKACDITGVTGAMVLRPATLQFDANTAGARGFLISGGKAPYTVAMLDAPPDWMTPVFNGGLADTAQIKVSDKAVAGSYNLLVADSSPNRNSQILAVTIAAKSGQQDANTARNDVAPSTTDTGNFDTLAKAMADKWKITPLEVLGVKLTVGKAEVVDGKAIKVSFTCATKQAAGWPNANDTGKIAEQLSLADKVATKALLASKAIDAKFAQITLQPDAASCLPAAS